LLKVDQNILKLDSAFESTIKLHNQPIVDINVEELINNFIGFEGKVIIQTLFLRGTHNGKLIDNTTQVEIDAWLKAIERIKPSEVMIYTISRDTPEGARLNKIPLTELKKIAALVESIGIKTQVSG
jgi:wyosine [tRNA(Phe)-imidazoG37] synthetase (radical SAM superfamily)